MPVNLIAAVGNRGQLGFEGELPWYAPEDLTWFRKMTMGDAVVVGFNTAELLPNLDGRYVHVMQRGETPESVLADDFLKWGEFSALWVAGGAKTYKQWLPFVQRVYISRIDYDGPADAYMPQLWWKGDTE